jgi:hypothetical protein
VTPNFGVYGTGGFAWANITAQPTGFAGVSATNGGWALGGGMYVAPSTFANWAGAPVTLDLEGLYVNINKVQCTVLLCGGDETVGYSGFIARIRAELRIYAAWERVPSDARLKRDIAIVGQLPNGLHLYRFRYIWSDQLYVGVMAQEVAQVMPAAIAPGPYGALAVDYTKVGTTLQTWEEYSASVHTGAADSAQ